MRSEAMTRGPTETPRRPSASPEAGAAPRPGTSASRRCPGNRGAGRGGRGGVRSASPRRGGGRGAAKRAAGGRRASAPAAASRSPSSDSGGGGGSLRGLPSGHAVPEAPD